MGFLSHKLERSEIEEGDHIYTWKTGFTYSHHGIYVGGNKVVHFTHEQSKDSTTGFFVSSSSTRRVSSLYSSASCTEELPACSNIPDCGFHQPESGVVLSCLDCFLGGGSLYRFEYGISPLVFIAKLRGGTCTTAKSDAPKMVIHRAMCLLHNGFGSYNLFENNCEDFALYCKTGLLIHDKKSPGRSGQVSGVMCAPLAALLSTPLGWFMSNPITIATAGAGFYCFSRYATDIGVRSDVTKVEVEDMVSFHVSEGPKEPIKDISCRKRPLEPDQSDIPASKRQC
ncbi:hypothetical protein ACH5RR_038263 [Cinchona calisaya]|uniref:LRAT domain-containing protein n=1 Tax=Cinchona calisaya TaxID=153742 RepID=A0ABD2XYW4_9GENT